MAMAMRSTLHRAARLLRSSSSSSQRWRSLYHATTACGARTSELSSHHPGQPGLRRPHPSPPGLFPHQARHMSSDLSALPDIKDDGIRKAMNALLSTSWLKIESHCRSAVQRALSGGSDDAAGKEALADAWRSAQAIEKFGGLLNEMLMELNDLSGDTGEEVRMIPDSTYNAVEAAYKKYCTYLDSFGNDELYLKKKVENELGGLLLQIKQRVSGMDPKWSKITLLGTSGLSGSYIERRGTVA